MSYLSEQQVDRISNLVKEVEKLSDVEKLLLYLQLPCGRAELPEGEFDSCQPHDDGLVLNASA
jgi:hypothetical protein